MSLDDPFNPSFTYCMMIVKFIIFVKLFVIVVILTKYKFILFETLKKRTWVFLNTGIRRKTSMLLLPMNMLSFWGLLWNFFLSFVDDNTIRNYSLLIGTINCLKDLCNLKNISNSKEYQWEYLKASFLFVEMSEFVVRKNCIINK